MPQDALPWLSRWIGERQPGLSLSEDEDFYAAHAIDSFGFVCLLGDVEDVFSVRLEFEDLRAPQAKTIRGLAALIEAKRRDA